MTQHRTKSQAMSVALYEKAISRIGGVYQIVSLAQPTPNFGVVISVRDHISIVQECAALMSSLATV